MVIRLLGKNFAVVVRLLSKKGTVETKILPCSRSMRLLGKKGRCQSGVVYILPCGAGHAAQQKGQIAQSSAFCSVVTARGCSMKRAHDREAWILLCACSFVETHQIAAFNTCHESHCKVLLGKKESCCKVLLGEKESHCEVPLGKKESHCMMPLGEKGREENFAVWSQVGKESRNDRAVHFAFGKILLCGHSTIHVVCILSWSYIHLEWGNSL